MSQETDFENRVKRGLIEDIIYCNNGNEHRYCGGENCIVCGVDRSEVNFARNVLEEEEDSKCQ